ncbi:hypothetical protein EE612_006652 [Oryza sativa]|nr:hypothetical protein EE612_006652 [Oryza sativa]
MTTPATAMAISSRAAACGALIFPTTASAAPVSRSVSVDQRVSHRRRKAVAVAAVPHASGGGALLERPAFDQSQLDTLPVTQEGDLSIMCNDVLFAILRPL